MQRRPVLPLGLKFDPTDVELISGFLYTKFHGGRLPWNAIGSCDLVYEKPPWEFCTDLTAFPGDEKHYFFTERKRNRNRVVRTVGSYGTWHESSSKNISGIGFNKLLNFKVKGEGKKMKTTDWLMHEFSLPDKKINLVLCVIQKKKKKQEAMVSAYNTDPEIDPNSYLGDYVAALDTEEDTEQEETRPSKKMRSDPEFGDGPFCGRDPCPAPAHGDQFKSQAMDSEEEEETRPSKKMRSDPEFGDDPFCGGDPCPAPALGDQFKLQALDSEEEETRPSKKMRSDPEFGDDPFCGGDPCPAPAHGDQDSEEQETRPSKETQSDPNSDGHPYSIPNSSAGYKPNPDFWLDRVPGFPYEVGDGFLHLNTYCSFFGGDPCPAPAHGDQNSEEQETRPSKEMQSDPNSNDHPYSVPNSSADYIPGFWTDSYTGFACEDDDAFLQTNTDYSLSFLSWFT